MKKSIECVLRQLEGLNTLDLVQKKLSVRKSTAIKKLCQLRKLGFVETSGGGKQPRLYRISRIKFQKIGNPGLYEVINKNSPIKLVKPYEHRVMGRRLSIEEVIVMAVKTENFRVVLAALALFNKLRNWPRLYTYAKKEGVRRKIGALYDVARAVIRVRKMPKKIRKLLLRAREKGRHIIPLIKVKDFQDISREWKIYVPFNKADLARYKE